MQRKTSTVNPSLKVSDIVRNNYRTADIFKSYGINYCCGGDISLQEACSAKGVDLDEVEQALQPAITTLPFNRNVAYSKWKLDFLIDYLVNIHHAYLQQTLPALDASFTTYVEGHKIKYPQLVEVLKIYKELSEKLHQHNHTEETSIFPYLKQMINAYNRKETYGALFVKTMRKPLQRILEKEYQQITELLSQLREATNNYSIPEGACTNYYVYMNKLAELDTDLVQHKHLENNILFPKVLEMEKELLQL